jgi:hypothetical protein
MPTTQEILSAAELLNVDFVTHRKEQRGRTMDFHHGQILAITVTRPGHAMITLRRFRYEGNDQWDPIEQSV